MSDKKITELSSASSLVSSDLFVVVNADQTRKTTLDSLKTFVNAQDYIPLIYDDLSDLRASSGLTPGALYFITDRNIWLRGLSTSQLSLTGDYLRTCPKFESIGTDITGIWNSGTTYALNNRTIWNNQVWKSLQNSNTNQQPDTHPTYWEIEPATSSTYYKQELYSCEFDFDNDWIQLVHDTHRGNRIGGSYRYEQSAVNGFNVIERFPWGNDRCFGNTCVDGLLNLRNVLGQVNYVHVEERGIVNNITMSSFGAMFCINLGTGAVLSDTTINGTFYNINIGSGSSNTSSGGKIANKTIANGAAVGNITVGNLAWDGTETIFSALSEKRLVSGFSNLGATLDLSDSTIFNAATSTLTIPNSAKSAGIVTLTGTASSYSIAKITSLSSSFPTEFRAKNGKTITFAGTPIGTIGTDQIALEEPRNFVLTGRTNGSDALVLQKEGSFNRQVRHSSLLSTSSTAVLDTSLANGDIPYYDGSVLQPSGVKNDAAGDAVRLNDNIVLGSFTSGKSQIDFGAAGDHVILSTDGGTLAESALYLVPTQAKLSSAYGYLDSVSTGMTISDGTKIKLDAPVLNLAQLTASTVPYLDASKNLVSSSVTPTVLGYLDATSSVQTQLNARELLSNKATDFSTVNNTLYPTVQAVQNYVTGAVAGLLDYRGSYDASTNTFPSSGGSGTAGAILKGDFWFATVAGTLGGTAVKVGDMIIANVDSPGTTASNWDLISVDLGYVAANVANPLSQFAATTSAQLAGVISDETGYSSGALLVFSKSPSIDAPTITGHPTLEGVTATGATGTGKLVFDNAPTLTSPSITKIGNLTSNGVLTTTSGDGTLTVNTNLLKDSISVTFDGLGGVIAVNSVAGLTINYSGTITGWEIVEDSSTPVSSSVVVGVWKDTYANFPPTSADEIFTTKPTLSSATSNQNLSPTFVGSATVTAGDVFRFNINSCSSAVRVRVTLFITRS